mmetsp:Transcript_21775/g.60527  ORF Transcript_21775/g.60527 Transcript_21775/m.60527 type:complete len:342 (-) Transcript_21775:80-1105(-)|eukprot:CAMPEP_0117668922 /NCGR_PEP_ID=MMETSP0804-20121206/11832_1 /TAXON_ID=1074897 /ORGANISM="Tetraselmis astigmatica, Strain CCMP880" /LENGTH=341 /DNA_ID=CAMNT_0005476895 /DNA_START=59 /DNA_END=1084 /DNA_ORIENTATION=-
MSRAIVALLLVALPAVALAAEYDYKLMAEDWKSMECTWCGSVEQTPIDLMAEAEMGSYVQMPMQFAPTFNLPSVTDAFVANNGHNVNLEFATAPGATFRFPKGSTFTSLNGEYTSFGPSDGCTTETPVAVPKSNFPPADMQNSDDEEVEAVQGTLLDLHWHVPSEHSVNGKLYAAEAHFVHFVPRPNDPDCTFGPDGDLCLAVIGVFYDLHSDLTEQQLDPGFTSVMEQVVALPDENSADTAPNATFNFNEFLPESKEFFHYRGSLTTPGCNENVTWFVMQEPKIMGYSHWAALHDAIIYDHLGNTNARPPLPLNNRTVKVSNYEEATNPTPPAVINLPCQ